MADRPFIQIYTADYLSETQALTTEQHGAYILLTLAMWNAGGYLTADPVRLATITHTSARRWKSIAHEVLSLFDLEAGRLTSPRMVEMIRKVDARVASKRANGAIGGRAKSLRYNSQALASASRSLDDSPLYARALIHIEDTTGAEAPSIKGAGIEVQRSDLALFEACVRLWNEEVPGWRQQQRFPEDIVEAAKASLPKPGDLTTRTEA